MKKILSVIMATVIVISLTACASAKNAEEQPSSNGMPAADVNTICATNAGGAMDTAVRLLAPYVEKLTGHNAPIENIAGSAGWVALAQLATRKDTNYEVCYVAFPQIIIASMDPENDIGMTIDDFTPIALDVDDSNIIVGIGTESRFSNLQEFLDYAKETQVLVGISAGVYSDDNVCKTYIQNEIPEVKFQAVHFTSTSEGMAAVMGGHIDVLICNVSEAAANINAGELLGVGVCSEEKHQAVPGVQTFKELGYDVVNGSTRGYVAKGTISDQMKTELCNVYDQAMSNEEYQKASAEKFMNLKHMVGDDFVSWLTEQKEDMEKIYATLE